MSEYNSKRNKFHKDNKGVSLVEVIVAMAILAVVAAPALKILVSSTRYNAKARERQKLTTSAESIMESFKAYTVDELMEQFNGINGKTFTACQMDAAASMSGVETVDIDAAGNSAEAYDFALNGILNEGKTYDAVIHVNKRYLPGVDSRIASDNGVVAITDINQYTDAVLKWNLNYDVRMSDAAKDDFKNNHMYELIDELNSSDKIKNDYTEMDIDLNKIVLYKRQITVNMYEASGNTVVTYGLKCSYKIEGYPYHADELDDSVIETFDLPESGYFETDVPLDGSTTAQIYRNPSSEPLQRVFIFYYPNYGIDVDEIVINSSLSYETTAYLLKQKNPSLSDTELQNREAAYKANVRGSGRVKLAHNLDKNLSGKSSVSTSSISGFSSVGSYTQDYGRSTDEIFMYDIKLTIYKAGEVGTGAPLVEIEGSKYE